MAVSLDQAYMENGHSSKSQRSMSELVIDGTEIGQEIRLIAEYRQGIIHGTLFIED